MLDGPGRCAALVIALLAAQAVASEPPQRLYRLDFDAPLELGDPDSCWGTGCWQEIVTNGSRRSPSPGAVATPLDALAPVFLLIADPLEVTPATIGEYLQNRIVSAERGGATNRVLEQSIRRHADGIGPMGTAPTQAALLFVPRNGARELYVRYRMKLQPDLVQRMTGLPDTAGVQGGGTWRALFALKTGTLTAAGLPADDGDYRIEAYVMTYGGTRPYWALLADNNAGGGDVLRNAWTIRNPRVPVPVGEWFRFEIYWQRSDGDDGLVRMAVDCREVATQHGPNLGARQLPVNRIMAPLLYTGASMPAVQWIDEIEIWTAPPPDRCGGGAAGH